jgi:hypothetical protein
MKKILFLLLALALLCSCTPQKRLERLIKKHPELADTTIIRDTTIIEGWHYDTIAKLGETDTVVVTKEGTTVTIYKWNTDSIFVEVEAEPDTIFKEIPCPQIMPLEAKDDWYIEYWWLILLIFVAILFILNKIFK